MAVAADPDWEQDRRRFVSRIGGGSSRRGSIRAADDRTGLWSPLTRQFAEIGRDLYAARDLVGILREIVALGVLIVPGARWASVTMCRAGGPMHTASHTHESAVLVDQLQERFGEGPFADAVRQDGTGMAASADLVSETSWPEFGPSAAEAGARSVLAAGVFPGDQRYGTLNVYATEPRGLAAADPDVLLILASFAAAALGSGDAVAQDEMRDVLVGVPLASSRAEECGRRFLMDKRHLDAGEAYDILRRASAEVIESWQYS